MNIITKSRLAELERLKLQTADVAEEEARKDFRFASAGAAGLPWFKRLTEEERSELERAFVFYVRGGALRACAHLQLHGRLA